MPFDVFEPLLNQITSLGGLEHIILSGMGDPSMNPELIDMVGLAHRLGLSVTIITNLLQVDLHRLFAVDSGIDRNRLTFLASICGVTEPVWNAFHAMSVGFDRLLSQLALMKTVGYRPKHVQVINAQNFHQLDQMIHFADTWPARRINFKFASLANGTEVHALSDQQKRRLTDELIPLAMTTAQFLGIETDLDAFATQVHQGSHRTTPVVPVGCYMGSIYCRITVDLELLFCCNTEVSVGQLANPNDFRDWWFSQPYQALRDRMAANDFLESCAQCGKYKQNLKISQKIQQWGRGTNAGQAIDWSETTGGG